MAIPMEVKKKAKEDNAIVNYSRRLHAEMHKSIRLAQTSKNPESKLSRLETAKHLIHKIKQLANSNRNIIISSIRLSDEQILGNKALSNYYSFHNIYDLDLTEITIEQLCKSAKLEILKQTEEKISIEKAKQELKSRKDKERQQLLAEKQSKATEKAQLARQKELERQKLADERKRTKALANAEKDRLSQQKMELRFNSLQSKESKQNYLHERAAEALYRNVALEKAIDVLSNILLYSITDSGTISLSELQIKKYGSNDNESIVGYYAELLEQSKYPDGFPGKSRIAYNSESKELVVDHELPPLSIIPATKEYSYVKTKDTIVGKPRKSSEINELYQDVVASVALRTINEVFKADINGKLEVMVFSGYVNTVDPATGRDIHPYLISVRATKSIFMALDLTRVDKRACLRNLGAQLSPQPSAMLPVKPIVYFNMTDKRFVEYGDVLSGLDTKPNLMELNPWEFETLVSNLFAKWGLETKLTRSTKDGGVDAIAFDTRAFLGGKFVIQAKRYKNTVGVSAVRDLYGTMLNEGANKGILVTTSGYGPDAFDFAKDKPIELIDGGQLLYMLDQVGVQAKIIMPEEGQAGFNEFENMQN